MKYIIAIVVIALAVAYGRGVNQFLQQQKLNCHWYTVYAVCKSDTDLKPPSFIDAVRAGVKF